jgi:hypothetical protein
MKNIFFISLLLLALGSAKADDPARQQPEIPIFQEGFKNAGATFWATSGAGLATSDNPEALFFNPAWQTSSRFLLIAGGTHHLKSSHKFSNATLHYNNELLLPSYALVAINHRYGMLVLGFQQLYDLSKSISDVHYTLPAAWAEAPIESDHTTVREFFVGINHTFPRHFSFGVQAGLTRFETERIAVAHSGSITGSDYSYRLSVGAEYHFQPKMYFTLAYHYYAPFSYTPAYHNIEHTTPVVQKEVTLPSRAEIGFAFAPFNFAQFLFRAEFQNWHSVNSALENQWEYALGLTLQPKQRWRVHFGSFFDNQYLSLTRSIKNAFFISTGIDFKVLSTFTLSLSGFTNEPFAHDSQIKRTQWMFGFHWIWP